LTGGITAPQDADMTAAFWSAVAAFFAAASSFMIFLVQRRNLRESVRPELVLTDWERRADGTENPGHETLCFRNIRNVGRGAAMHVRVNLVLPGDRPPATLGTISRTILAPSESSRINAQITLFWQNAKLVEDSKYLPITVAIYCLDTVGNRYETRYGLLVTELPEQAGVHDTIVPGVMLHARRVRSKSVRYMKLSKWGRRHWTRAQERYPQITKAQEWTRKKWTDLKAK